MEKGNTLEILLKALTIYIFTPFDIFMPLRIMFNASVAVFVNTTFLLEQWKSCKSNSLVSSAIELAFADNICCPRPKLTPLVLVNLSIVVYTHSGFGNVVAALSKYTKSSIVPTSFRLLTEF